MIAYRDFPYTAFGLWLLEEEERVNFDQALSQANEWIDRESIDVIQVETVGYGMFKQAFRVWYRKPAAKAATVPEV